MRRVLGSDDRYTINRMSHFVDHEGAGGETARGISRLLGVSGLGDTNKGKYGVPGRYEHQLGHRHGGARRVATTGGG